MSRKRNKNQLVPTQGQTSGMQSRNDGLLNALTGLGNGYYDKTASSNFSFVFAPMSETILSNMYDGDGIVAKIVNLPAEEMTKEFIELPEDLEEIIKTELTRIKFYQLIEKALKYRNLYGGSVIVLDILDGQLPETPVNPAMVKGIGKRSFVLHKDRVTPVNYVENQESEWFWVSNAGNNILTHRSRLLIFDGAECSAAFRNMNSGWGLSEVQRILDAYTAYTSVNQSVPNITSDFKDSTVKMKGLNQMIASSKSDSTRLQEIQTKIRTMKLAKGICGLNVVDGEDDVITSTLSITGFDQLSKASKDWLSAQSNIPHTKLFSESPGTGSSALSTTGNSQLTDWYDRIKSMQVLLMHEPIAYVLSLISSYMKIPSNIKFSFKSLWQMDDEQNARIKKTEAETDEIYIRNRVMIPQEVAQLRFADSKVIDFKSRARLKAIPEGGNNV